MNGLTLRTRIVLVVLIGLLALPIVETASPVEAKRRWRTVTKTFHYSAPISLIIDEGDDPVSANHYPSEIEVSGLKGTIRDVNLRLTSFTHTYPDDVQMLLVGPRGQTAVVMANVGGSDDVFAVTLRLDDEAAAALPDQDELQSGTFRPTNATASVVAFNDPAPEASADAALSVFDGSPPNGTWRLFVQDEYGPTDPGVFAGGWTLEITAKVKINKKKR